MRRIPVLGESLKPVESKISLREFLQMQIPYLEKSNPSNTVVNFDGHVIVQGKKELPILTLDRNMELSPMERAFDPKRKIVAADLFKEKLSIRIGDFKIPLITAFAHKFTKIFDVKWINEVLNEDEKEELKNYLTLRKNRETGILEIPEDSPISKRVNIFTLFLFLGYGAEFFEMMALNKDEQVRVYLEKLFQGWNVENVYDVYEFAKGVSMNASDIDREIGKLAKESTKPSKRYILGLSCEHLGLESPKCSGSTSRSESLEFILQEVLKLKNGLFGKLQELRQVDQFGMVLFLNIWTLMAMRDQGFTMTLPFSSNQQFHSLKNLLTEKDPDTPKYKEIVETTLIDLASIPTGNYKGIAFPPCVENGLFQLMQMLTIDPNTKKRNGKFLKTTNQELIDFLNTPGDLSVEKWINMVSEKSGISYGKAGVCDIRSDKSNVLKVMNLLVQGKARNLKEWVDGVVNNPNLKVEADDEKDTIVISADGLRAVMKIMNGHTSFDIEGKDKKITFPTSNYSIGFYKFVGISPTLDFVRQLFTLPDKNPEGTIVQILRQKEAFEIFNNNDEIFNSFKSLNDFSRAVSIGMTPERLAQGCYTWQSSRFDEKDLYTISKVLENKIERLEIVREIPFNRLTIPNGVKVLKIWYPMSGKLIEKGCEGGKGTKCSPFPESVVDLELYIENTLQVGFLPPNLNRLYLRRSPKLKEGVFPESLRELIMEYSGTFEKGILPSKLEELFVGDAIDDISKVYLPRTLKRLGLHTIYQEIPLGFLPPNLEHLNLGSRYDYALRRGVLPSSLKELILSKNFESVIEQGCLPEGLEYLKLGDNVSNKIIVNGILPSTLKNLLYGFNYRHPITPGLLPPNLEGLKLGYDQTIQPGSLPPSLKKIALYQKTLDGIPQGIIPKDVGLRIIPDVEE